MCEGSVAESAPKSRQLSLSGLFTGVSELVSLTQKRKPARPKSHDRRPLKNKIIEEPNFFDIQCVYKLVISRKNQFVFLWFVEIIYALPALARIYVYDYEYVHMYICI